MYKKPIDDSEREINISLYGTVQPLTRETQETGLLNPAELGFPVVGVGASSGGQEAFQRFLSRLPLDNELAVVLVSHLHPEYPTLLPELLAKYTRLPIILVEEGLKIQPNTVYLIPPGKIMFLEGDRFHLAKRQEFPRLNLAVDYFFKSMAVALGARSIAVVLSGEGTDGWRGTTAVKARLGISLVQDPQTTQFPGMIQNVLNTQLADYVAAPEELPGKIIRYLKTTRENYPQIRQSLFQDSQGQEEVFDLLKQQTNLDFRAYKRELIFGRLARRMNVRGLNDLSGYVRFLKANPGETWRLFKELLIDVPVFFRNPEGFEHFKEALKIYLSGKPEGSLIQGWVAGCAGGEESYSVAITVQEAMEELRKSFDFHLYATDIEVDSLNFARSGVFPASIAPDTGEERLKKYFTREDNLFRVKDEIKSRITFSVHNLLGDFPFSKVDFISCRNIFNILKEETQEALIPALHYALKKDGILFLGITDSIQGHTELFLPLNKQWRVYRRQAIVGEEKITLRLPIIPSVYGSVVSP